MTTRLLLALCLAAPAWAEPPPLGERLVTEARRFLGTPYELGGRTRRTKRGAEGLDCQGLVFAAAERVQRCGWKSFSVFPTAMKADRSLGEPVEGLAPVATAKLELAKLQAGDVLMLIQSTENPKEPAIAELEGTPVWVWHMALYSGGGKFIVGDHFAGEVVEEELLPYLQAHADSYDGLYVLRPTTVAPPRCRLHPRMTPPQPASGPGAHLR